MTSHMSMQHVLRADNIKLLQPWDTAIPPIMTKNPTISKNKSKVSPPPSCQSSHIKKWQHHESSISNSDNESEDSGAETTTAKKKRRKKAPPRKTNSESESPSDKPSNKRSNKQVEFIDVPDTLSVSDEEVDDGEGKSQQSKRCFTKARATSPDSDGSEKPEPGSEWVSFLLDFLFDGLPFKVPWWLEEETSDCPSSEQARKEGPGEGHCIEIGRASCRERVCLAV